MNVFEGCKASLAFWFCVCRETSQQARFVYFSNYFKGWSLPGDHCEERCDSLSFLVGRYQRESVSLWFPACPCPCIWMRGCLFSIIKELIWSGRCAWSHFSVSLVMFPSIAEAVEHLELVSDCQFLWREVVLHLVFASLFLPPNSILERHTFCPWKAYCKCALWAFLYRKCVVVNVRAQSVELAGYEMNEWFILTSTFLFSTGFGYSASGPLIRLSLVTSAQAGLSAVI